MKKKIKLNLNKKTISNLKHVFGGTGETIFDDLTNSVYIGPCPDPGYTDSCDSCRETCGIITCYPTFPNGPDRSLRNC